VTINFNSTHKFNHLINATYNQKSFLRHEDIPMKVNINQVIIGIDNVTYRNHLSIIHFLSPYCPLLSQESI